MGNEDPDSTRDQEGSGEGPEGEAAGISDPSSTELAFPPQSPLFRAQHSERYDRQDLIRAYESRVGCRLVVLIDVLFPETITLFEELIIDADPTEDLHLLLYTPGGDGETAIRLARSAQARCKEFTVIVPDQAKSAGTLLTMGAHHILMGPTSDLGPVDPQFPNPSGGGLYAAKDLIAAVEHAEQAIAANPDSYPLHVSLLADVSAVMVQQARSALARSSDLVKEALTSHPDRSADDIEKLAQAVAEPLIDLPRDHGAVFDGKDAESAGLPVIHVDPGGEQWQLIWRLWAKYFKLGFPISVAEGRSASQVMPMSQV